MAAGAWPRCSTEPAPGAAPLPVAANDALNSLAARVLEQQGAQRDLPRVAADPVSVLDRWTLNLPDVVLVVVLAACAVLLAVVVLRLRRTPPDWAVPGAQDAGAAAGGAAHLAAARAHAEAGRLQEALHELLLQALADVRRHGGLRLDASLTSREVLRQARLPEDGQAALGGIITDVEWTYFGLRPATLAAWEACLARLERLNAALAA